MDYCWVVFWSFFSFDILACDLMTIFRDIFKCLSLFHRYIYDGFLVCGYQCCYCSVAKSCPALCNPMNFSTAGFPDLHHLPEFLKLMSVEPAMPPNHLENPLSPASPVLNLFQHHDLFQWIISSHQVAKVLEWLPWGLYTPSYVYMIILSCCSKFKCILTTHSHLRLWHHVLHFRACVSLNYVLCI